jgi:hypothetical protein
MCSLRTMERASDAPLASLLVECLRISYITDDACLRKMLQRCVVCKSEADDSAPTSLAVLALSTEHGIAFIRDVLLRVRRT